MKAFLERLALVTFSVALLGGVEAALRLVDYGSDDHAALDFGLPSSERIFVPDERNPDSMVVAPFIIGMLHGTSHFINEDTFPRKRPPGELRIVAIGESFVYGVPVGGPMAFPYQLGELVRKAHPGLPVDVINVGLPGYDARRLLKVTEEMLQYQPSVIVYATGNNEYFRRFAVESLKELGPRIRARQCLHRLRVYQLLARLLRPVTGKQMLGGIDVTELTHELGKREGWGLARTTHETELVHEKFRANLTRAIEAIREAGVPLVLCTLPNNMKSYPERTVYDADVTAEQQGKAESIRHEVKHMFRHGAPSREIEGKCREGLAIAPRHAQFHHFLAQALEAQDRLPEALDHYLLARDLESTPRRSCRAFAQDVRELGPPAGATVVDLEKLFLSDMTHGHWGENLFLDHCHPTEEGNAVVAKAIYESVDWTSLPR